MTVVWAWADLGNHDLQNYNIKQYWLIMSVLSVKKFNPEWKRVFFVDQVTYNFLSNKNWISLWDEVNVIDFTNTEYGNLYDIKIYSWPKIYSYKLVDDDILILDTDIVFVKKFVIPDTTKMCGQFYNYCYNIKNNYDDKITFNFRKIWKTEMLKTIAELDRYDIALNYRMTDESICLIGSPIYVPKGLGKYIANELLEHIHEVETRGGLCEHKLIGPMFYAIEEEYPIASIGKRCVGLYPLNKNMYKHGFCGSCKINIDHGFKIPESIIGIPIFDTYFT